MAVEEHDGVFFFDTDSPSSPYGAYYYTLKPLPSGKRKSVAVRRRFAQPEEREIWAEEVRSIRRLEGSRSGALDPAKRRRWEIASGIIGDADPVEVAKYWVAHRPAAFGAPGRGARVDRVLSEFLEARDSDPAFEANQYRAHFERFCAAFGGLSAPELERSAGRVTEWLDSLPLAQETKRNQYKRVNVAFSWALRTGRIDRHPFARVEIPRRKRSDVEFMPVEDVERLFAANRHLPGRCAKLALELFGGMRTSAVSRVHLADLKTDVPGVETPAWKTKAERRHFIEGQPPNLWPWLALASEGDFAPPCPKWKSLPHRQRWKARCKAAWMHEKSDALELAGLKSPGEFAPPPNWARHSFVTHHVALFRDLALTSTLVSHAKSVEVLREHYLGIETRARAKRYFAILPDSPAVLG